MLSYRQKYFNKGIWQTFKIEGPRNRNSRIWHLNTQTLKGIQGKIIKELLLGILIKSHETPHYLYSCATLTSSQSDMFNNFLWQISLYIRSKVTLGKRFYQRVN